MKMKSLWNRISIWFLNHDHKYRGRGMAWPQNRLNTFSSIRCNLSREWILIFLRKLLKFIQMIYNVQKLKYLHANLILSIDHSTLERQNKAKNWRVDETMYHPHILHILITDNAFQVEGNICVQHFKSSSLSYFWNAHFYSSIHIKNVWESLWVWIIRMH